MHWQLSDRFDKRALPIADSHMATTNAIRLCALCGVRPVARARNRYCSTQCSNRATAPAKARAATVPPAIRFWAKVKKSEGCWEWQGSGLPDGYGHFGINKRRIVLAHVFAYEDTYGKATSGKEIHHACKNRGCVRPDHLEAVTPKEHAAQHRKTECKRGHLLEGSNIRITKDGRRDCRVCQRIRYHKNRGRNALAS